MLHRNRFGAKKDNDFGTPRSYEELQNFYENTSTGSPQELREPDESLLVSEDLKDEPQTSLEKQDTFESPKTVQTFRMKMFGFDFEEDLSLAEGEFLRLKQRKISQEEEGFRSTNDDHDFFYPESQKTKTEKNMFLSAESSEIYKESV